MKLRIDILKRYTEQTKLELNFRERKGERTQINKIGNEREDITTDTTEIQRIIKDYHEQL